MASVVVDGMVYIRDAFGAEELFDLARDPDEFHNLAGEPAALGRCRVALDRLTGEASTVRR